MLALFVIWTPTVLALIFLIAAGILFARVRSPASGIFFFGALVTTLAPWASNVVRNMEYTLPLVMVFGLTVQVLGFFAYALSVPRKAQSS
ncbi:MAG TPA: hypothetical protein VNH16_06980 [Burkholderiales bacterium]|nr:hypothetical protein [Burkholderiales bacterium]